MYLRKLGGLNVINVRTVLVFAVMLASTVGLDQSAGAEGSSDRNWKIYETDCLFCHTYKKGDPDGQGPNLYGVVGRPAGARKGFNYTPVFLKVFKGKVWSAELLDQYLTDTQAFTPGTGMTYFQEDNHLRETFIRFMGMTDAK